ncbi:hypothetical protein NEDG_01609 [Nematocida displodere]|uniref:CCHC-type domain-containing protein n=1 Tax=Nematocida displodere TaxID=1805483 RepID=A0A177EHK7_9MICR|nr:hypothetical protein NEDG_01609 [Nematocida displodere]
MELPQFLHNSTIELSELAETALIERIAALHDDESISDETANEIYTHMHFGSSQQHTLQNRERLEPIESRRYFQSSITCYQCKNLGHTSRDCPRNTANICTLCGDKHHRRNRCPKRVCRRCSMTGHSESFCPKPARTSQCNTCAPLVHASSECPLYRHEAKVCEPVGRIHKTCCYCGTQEHFASECKNRTEYGTSTFYVLPPRYNRKIEPTQQGPAKTAEKSQGGSKHPQDKEQAQETVKKGKKKTKKGK